MQAIHTSVTLLNAIANNTETVRWTEFFTKYEPMMRAFLSSHFPSLDHDDIIQESMKALIKQLPGYIYTPDRNGHFKAYLTGIVKYKALDQLRKLKRIKDLKNRCADDSATATACDICTPCIPNHIGSNRSAGRKNSPLRQMLSNVAGPVMRIF